MYNDRQSFGTMYLFLFARVDKEKYIIVCFVLPAHRDTIVGCKTIQWKIFVFNDNIKEAL